MPDGDIVHPTLTARYYSPYKQMCEGASSEEELARDLLQCLKKDLKDYGEEPIQLIGQEAALFDAIATQMQNGIEIDWSQERKNIKELAQHMSGQKRALQLVVRGCEQQVAVLQMEQRYQGSWYNFSLEISKHYLLNVYDAQFAKKAEQTRHHYNQVDPEAIRIKLGDIRPLVIKGIEAYANQITKKSSIKRLRLPTRSSKARKIDLRSDLDRDISELI